MYDISQGTCILSLIVHDHFIYRFAVPPCILGNNFASSTNLYSCRRPFLGSLVALKYGYYEYANFLHPSMYIKEGYNFFKRTYTVDN